MIQELEAVGFDIDGTLYPESAMYLCSLPAFFRAPLLMSHFGRMRREIRSHEPARSQDEFRNQQASLILQAMGRVADTASIAKTLERIDSCIYGTWLQSFKSIRPFEGVKELFRALGDSPYKVGLLSDFPPGIKPEALGIGSYCDAITSAEDTGQLKPHQAPFLQFALELGVSDPSKMLYVGNSYSKDIIGARAAGMKTALYIHPVHIRRSKRSYPEADIVFSSYQELMHILFPSAVDK